MPCGQINCRFQEPSVLLRATADVGGWCVALVLDDALSGAAEDPIEVFPDLPRRLAARVHQEGPGNRVASITGRAH